MVTETVVTPTGVYLTVEGDRLRTQALVVLPLVDEWTGAAPEQVRATSRAPWVDAHVTDGFLVLTGVPDRAMPHLATAAQTLVVRIERPGRGRYDVELVVPLGSALPWRGPDLALDSTRVAVAGRVREEDFPHPAVPNATLDVQGVGSQRLVALRTPLAFAHDPGITVRRRNLTQTGTATAAAATAGGMRVVVTPTTGIGSGTVLAIGLPEREEHVAATGLEPGNVVVLKVPLVRTVVDGAPVRRFTAGGVSGATTLTRAARPGDGVVVTAAASTADVLEVNDGARTELRSTGLRSDAAGGWRLDGVRGISRISLTVSAAGLTTVGPVVHPLSGTSDPNVLDIDLPA